MKLDILPKTCISISQITFIFIVAYLTSCTSSKIDDKRLCQNNKNALPLELTFNQDSSIGGLLLLPVTFNHQSYFFVFDTGASVTILDSSFIPYLGKTEKKETVITPTGSVVMTEYNMPFMHLDRLLIQGEKVLVHDFKILRQVLGRDIRGVIGMDFLKRFAIQIDFDNQKILFIDPQELDIENIGVEIPLYSDDVINIHYVKLNLHNEIENTIIDTGSNHNEISERLFFRVFEKEKPKTSNSMSADLSSVSSSSQIRLDNINLGPFEYKSIIFDTSNETRLGLFFLSRHKVTFDFVHRKIVFG